MTLPMLYLNSMVTKEAMSEDMQYLEQVRAEIEAAKASGQYNYPPTTQFGQPQKQNLVEWQLDFRAELEDIEHLLRSDILVRDRNGNEYWDRNPDKDVVVFNDRGVNEILKEIRMFLNKNTVLSNYKADEIRQRLKAFGHELRALIYNNYLEYGLNTDYKLNHFPMIVITILSMVESAYRRALNGEERRDLNQARVVNQNDPMNQMQMYPGMQMQQQKQRSLFKPWTW